MNLSLLILIVLFVAFLLILILNPNLTCFGRRLRSPFYPLRRRRLMAAKNRAVKTEDYGFELVEGEDKPREKGGGDPPLDREETSPPQPATGKPRKPPKAEDYGFKLD